MSKNIIVRKQSGEEQPFSGDKLLSSIIRAGATEEIAIRVLDEIRRELYDGITTKMIYQKAFQLLRRKMRSLAARYSIKSALMELGPSGYPFERFVGEIFRKQGFSVKTGQLVEGRCIRHEMDVIAEGSGVTIMAECKYGNDQGKISSVQVPLYVNSRMKDIEARWRTEPGNESKAFQGWIVTNTRFSEDAEIYGTCAGLHLVSWSFPERDNLRYLVEKYALFPVTALTGLNKKQKQYLIEKNIILAENLKDNCNILNEFELTDRKRAEIMEEAELLAAIGRIC